MTRSAVWSQIQEVVKITVGILSTVWLGPKVAEVLPNEALSFFIVAVLSAVAIAIVSDKVLGFPTLVASWRNLVDGKETRSPVLEWSKAKGINRYDISFEVDARSVLGRVLLKKWVENASVKIDLGGAAAIACTASNSSGGLRAVRATGSSAECRLQLVSDGRYGGWARLEYELTGALPSYEQVQDVRVHLSNARGGSAGVPCHVSSNVESIAYREA